MYDMFQNNLNTNLGHNFSTFRFIPHLDFDQIFL